MDLKKFGEFIKTLRKEKGLNQEQLADELHVHRTTIVKWEQGSSLPLNDTLVLLSKYFNVSVDELLAGGIITNDSPVEEKSKVILSLLTSNRKSTRTIRHISIILFILALSFLIYYFFTTYNSIHVYLLYGDNSNYKTKDSLLIVSNDMVYLRIGNIYKSDGNQLIVPNKISLYVDEVNNTKLIFNGDPNEILIERRNNIEIFSNVYKLQKEYNNFYIVFTYNDKEEIININVKMDFENKSLISKLKNETIEYSYPKTSNIKLSEEFKYDKDNSSYKLKKNNFEIICATDRSVCKINTELKDSEIKYEYYPEIGIVKYRIINKELFENEFTMNILNDNSILNNDIYKYFKLNFLDKYLS